MRARLPSSIALSLLLHTVLALVVGTAFVSCTASTSQVMPPSPEAIDATVVTEQQAQRYYEEKRLAEEQRQREEARKKAAERKRRALEKERKRKAQQIELQKRKEAARKRKEEQLRQKQAQAAQQEKRKAEAREKALQEEQERKRAELKRRAQESLQQEEAKRAEAEQRRLLKMRKRQIGQWTRQYVNTLRSSIEAQWKKPPASIKGGDCLVRVQQKEDGTVLSADVVRCEGDKLYQRSVIEAVWKANPLPLPPNQDVFNSEIELQFRKEYDG